MNFKSHMKLLFPKIYFILLFEVPVCLTLGDANSKRDSLTSAACSQWVFSSYEPSSQSVWCVQLTASLLVTVNVTIMEHVTKSHCIVRAFCCALWAQSSSVIVQTGCKQECFHPWARLGILVGSCFGRLSVTVERINVWAILPCGWCKGGHITAGGSRSC